MIYLQSVNDKVTQYKTMLDKLSLNELKSYAEAIKNKLSHSKLSNLLESTELLSLPEILQKHKLVNFFCGPTGLIFESESYKGYLYYILEKANTFKQEDALLTQENFEHAYESISAFIEDLPPSHAETLATIITKTAGGPTKSNAETSKRFLQRILTSTERDRPIWVICKLGNWAREYGQKPDLLKEENLESFIENLAKDDLRTQKILFPQEVTEKAIHFSYTNYEKSSFAIVVLIIVILLILFAFLLSKV